MPRSATASASRCPLSLLRLRDRRRWSRWSTRRRHDPALGRSSTRCAALEAVEQERATALYGVPTMFIAELEHPEFDRFDLSQPAHRHHGRRPLPDRGDEAGLRPMHCRGDHHRLRADRSSPVITMSRVDDPLETARHHDRRGAAQHGGARSFDPETGEIAAARRARRTLHPRLPGDEGLRRRSPRPPPAPSTPRAGCTPATWPSCAPTAISIIRGRAKDMIIRGGENIYPREIEDFLHTHPKIADVYVVGLPDRRLGEIRAGLDQAEATETRPPRRRSANSAAARSRTSRSRSMSASSTRSR